MSPPLDPEEIVRLLSELRQEHRELDATIDQFVVTRGCDELQLTRLKKPSCSSRTILPNWKAN